MSPGTRTTIGAMCWILTLGYFVAEPIVAVAWPEPYSFAGNAISDLGATTCGEFIEFGGEPVFVCSPWHALMNGSFVVVGLLTAAGAVMTRRTWPRRRDATLAVWMVVLAGVGAVLVGFAPIDVNLAVHALGSILQFPGAVAPLLLVRSTWSTRPRVALVSLLCGLVGVVASGLFFAGAYLGLGLGTMERLAIYPLTIWTGVVGLILLHARSESAKTRT